jgi:hypothetical protein
MFSLGKGERIWIGQKKALKLGFAGWTIFFVFSIASARFQIFHMKITKKMIFLSFVLDNREGFRGG